MQPTSWLLGTAQPHDPRFSCTAAITPIADGDILKQPRATQRKHVSVLLHPPRQIKRCPHCQSTRRAMCRPSRAGRSRAGRDWLRKRAMQWVQLSHIPSPVDGAGDKHINTTVRWRGVKCYLGGAKGSVQREAGGTISLGYPECGLRRSRQSPLRVRLRLSSS